MEQVWDVALIKGSGGRLILSFPLPLGRALLERGYNRTSVLVMEEGMLLQPYAKEGAVSRKAEVDLPGWE